MANTLDWVEFRTDDIETLARFYGELFGWKTIAQETVDGSEVRIFDTGGEPRMENLRRGGIWARPAGERLGLVIYVHVADIEATLGQVAALGGKVARAREFMAGAYMAAFTDPCGNLIGLYEDVGSGAP